MCFFPGGMNILIPPTEKGRKIADYLKVALVLHGILSLLLLLGGRFIDGIFDIIGVTIGVFAIKNPDGYSFQSVLCYCVFCGMDLFWAILRLILYFSGVTSTSSSSLASWQNGIFVTTLIISPFIYIFATITSYYLYKDMKIIIDEMNNTMGGGHDDGGAMPPPHAGGQYSYQPQQNYNPPPPSSAPSSGSTWSHAPSNPQSGGFKAFSGQGHRLGGS